MQAAQTPPTNARKDTQIVELAGRNRLASELQRAGIEVARPERDRGVDLLAYLDRDDKFCARPIQMKASSREAFGVQRRYKEFPELMLVYVWNVDEPASRYFALTYAKAEKVAEDMGWTSTPSWKGETSGPPGYGVWKVNDELHGFLEEYEIKVSEDWKKRLFPENSQAL
jgi:hypothetical protein